MGPNATVFLYNFMENFPCETVLRVNPERVGKPADVSPFFMYILMSVISLDSRSITIVLFVNLNYVDNISPSTFIKIVL